MKQFVDEFLQRVTDKLSQTLDKIETCYPYSTVDGRYDAFNAAPYGWTAGFRGGILWLMYMYTGEARFKEAADKCTKHLYGGLEAFTPLGHDVGFQYFYTAVAKYCFTKAADARKSALHASTLLTGRFNPKGNFIRAWNDGVAIGEQENKAGYAIIDCMMNLPLLYWAWRETGDPRYRHIAVCHADMAMTYFIRDDGSSEHIVIFNPETGEIADKIAGQGYARGSAWTRGQGWALYGFTLSYCYTGEKQYLETARKIAGFIIENIPQSGVLPIDFRQPEKPDYVDSTAGVIIASGMLKLMEVDKENRETYQAAVYKLLKGAYQNCVFGEQEQSILQNGSEMYHKKESIHMPIIYGDYYLLEALLRASGCNPIWERIPS